LKDKFQTAGYEKVSAIPDSDLLSACHYTEGGGDMKYFCLSGRPLSLFVMGVTIATIFFAFSFGAIGTGHAAGLRTQGISETLKAENLHDFHGRLSNTVASWIKNGRMELGASFPSFRQKSLKAYRYRHEQYKMLKMVMGWVLIPIFYILKYPKVSLLLFFLVTVFLAILDEFLYRYKRYPDLSDAPTSEIESFYRGTYSQLVK
jgi:hypothetical protein